MKKKLMSLLSLILVVVMICPTMAFADETGVTVADDTETDEVGTSVATGSYTLYYDSTKTDKKSTTIACEGAASWSVINGTGVVSVNNGTVTALKAGTATVCAFDSSVKQIGIYTITVEAVALTKLEIMTESRSSYVSGTKISKSDLKVKATYNDGSEDPEFKDYTISPADAVTKDGKVTVSANGKTATMDYTVNEVSMKDMVTGISISAPASTAEYTVGDTIKTSDIELSIAYVGGVNNSATLASLKDAVCNLEFSGTGKYTFSNDDQKAVNKTITVSYAGYEASVTVKVKAKSTSGDSSSATQNTYLATKTGDLRTKTYKVGDQIKFDGITITFTVKSGNTTISTDTLTADQLNSSYSYTFKETDKGSNKSINVKIPYNGHDYIVNFSGLTVNADVDDSKVREISAIELKEKEYPIGYIFSKNDIDRLKVRFWGETSAKTLYEEDLSEYSFFSDSAFKLEVLTDDEKQKSSSTRRYTIEDSDIVEDDDGDKTVNMRLAYPYYSSSTSTSKKTNYLTFTVDVGDSDISYIYDGKLIAVYEELEDALEYCTEDDDDWDDFDLKDVKSSKYVTLRLGKDYKIDSSFDEFSPSECNIVIDLAGNDLRFYADTIEIDKEDKEYTVTVTNSSKNDAKFIYYDKSVTLTLGEDDKIVFEYDKGLPGFYTVEATADKGGKISASPALTSGKVEVGMGSTVKFTITPDTDYAIDTVKVNNKSVTSDTTNYKLSSNGTATYELKKINSNTKVAVTFKETKKAWKNPYSDISSNASYIDAIQFVDEHELFEGYTDGTFGPNKSMTRATFVTVLGRLAGVDKSRYTKSSFTDVPVDSTTSWYRPYVEWAVATGIVQGYGDGTFGPNNEITHQQMYLMMYRYSLFVENNQINVRNVSLKVSDAKDVADWALDGVKYAQQQDFLVLSGNRVDPTESARRWELATLLQDFCSNILKWAD